MTRCACSSRSNCAPTTAIASAGTHTQDEITGAVTRLSSTGQLPAIPSKFRFPFRIAVAGLVSWLTLVAGWFFLFSPDDIEAPMFAAKLAIIPPLVALILYFAHRWAAPTYPRK
jgi:hypothetical protein